MDQDSAVRQAAEIRRNGVVAEPEEIAPGVWSVGVDYADLERVSRLYGPFSVSDMAEL